MLHQPPNDLDVTVTQSLRRVLVTASHQNCALEVSMINRQLTFDFWQVKKLTFY